MYFVNGSQPLIIYDKKSGIARSLYTEPPGMPRITPLKLPAATTVADTMYQLTGEYKYLFKIKGYENDGLDDDTTITSFNGLFSRKIKLQNGRVLLEDFPAIPTKARVGVDSVTIDSMEVWIYRTEDGRVDLDGSDTAWFVDSMVIYNIDSTPALYADRFIIDSLPDTTITNNAARINSVEGFIIMNKDSVLTLIGRDSSATAIMQQRYGAPTFSSLTVRSDVNHGVFELTIRNSIDSIYGVAYNVTFVDSITGIESDTSISLAVMRDNANPTFQKVVINLPKIPEGKIGITRNVYRSLLISARRDTNWFTDTLAETETNCFLFDEPGGGKIKICHEVGGPVAHSGIVLDSIYKLKEYRIATGLGAGVNTFTDEIKNDSNFNINKISTSYN